MTTKTFKSELTITKFDPVSKMLFGFAIVSKANGERHFDLQGDHLPDSAILRAAEKFSKADRVAKLMHEGEPVGEVVFVFPMTEEVVKSLNIKTDKYGLLIGMRVEHSGIIKGIKEGVLKGFSIGGRVIESEAA